MTSVKLTSYLCYTASYWLRLSTNEKPGKLQIADLRSTVYNWCKLKYKCDLRLSEYIKHISDYFVNLLLHHSMSAASTPIYPAATCQYLPELFTFQELIPAKSHQIATHTLPGEVLNCRGSIPCLHLTSTLSPLQFTTVLNLFPASNHQVSTTSVLHLHRNVLNYQNEV